jgi:glutathione S-transferase
MPRLGWEAFKNLLCGLFDRSAIAEIRPSGRDDNNQPYLTGDRFTIADAYAYAVLNWTKIHNIDMRRWPRLMAFLDLVAARPAVRRARAEEGLE